MTQTNVHRRLRARGLMVAVVALLGCMGMTGCQYVGWFTQAFDENKTPPKYVLPQRTTLCLVDDPNHLMDDPTLPNYIGAQVAENLRFHEVIPATVPMNRVNDLRVQYGDEFGTLPIDRIGREAGADQVIYVNLYSVELYEGPGVRHPRASMLIKVVQASDGKRLYPPKDFEEAGEGVQPLPRGLPVTVALRKTYNTDRSDRFDDETMRKLAQRVARDVGRLFHEYPTEEPGEFFEEGW